MGTAKPRPLGRSHVGPSERITAICFAVAAKPRPSGRPGKTDRRDHIKMEMLQVRPPSAPINHTP
jgi:GTP-binding protein EngB required for normal cell division